MLFKVLLAVVPDTVPVAELSVAPAGETVHAYVAPAVPVALKATLVPIHTLDGTPAKPVGADGAVGSVKFALKALLPDGQVALLTLILV